MSEAQKRWDKAKRRGQYVSQGPAALVAEIERLEHRNADLARERDAESKRIDLAAERIAMLLGERDTAIAERDGAVGASNVFMASNGFLTSDVLELRARVQRLTEALTNIGEECRKFPIKNGLAFRVESMTLNALNPEPKP